MRCEEAAEWFGVYRDLPEYSTERLEVESHVNECKPCMEEFQIWEQSAQLIHDLPISDYDEEDTHTPDGVNQNVMNRIYSEQSWYLPTVKRTYTFTFAFRKKVAGLLAALFTIFICGFIYTSFNVTEEAGSSRVDAFSVSHQFGDKIRFDVPVASLSDPIMLKVSPAMPEYWVAFSMLGMIMTLLILNWFSRIRS